MRLIKKAIQHNHEPAAELKGYIIANSAEIEADRLHPAVIICPGGAYRLTTDREAEPIALKLVAEGCQAFVLRYSVNPVCYPVALHQLAKSVAYIRANAAHWNIDTDRIIVAGFSAGGHLAASLGVFWNSEALSSSGFSPEKIRPNGLLLGYPVITAGKFANRESIDNLLGKSTEDPAHQSLETQVTRATPKTFIWHTVADTSVPIENSLLFVESLQKNKIPFEFHVFPNGKHGLSLATKESSHDSSQNIPEVAVWFNLFLTWMKNNI